MREHFNIFFLFFLSWSRTLTRGVQEMEHFIRKHYVCNRPQHPLDSINHRAFWERLLPHPKEQKDEPFFHGGDLWKHVVRSNHPSHSTKCLAKGGGLLWRHAENHITIIVILVIMVAGDGPFPTKTFAAWSYVNSIVCHPPLWSVHLRLLDFNVLESLLIRAYTYDEPLPFQNQHF